MFYSIKALEILFTTKQVKEFNNNLVKAIASIVKIQGKNMPRGIAKMWRAVCDSQFESKPTPLLQMLDFLNMALSKQSTTSFSHFFNKTIRQREEQVEVFYTKLGEFGKLLKDNAEEIVNQFGNSDTDRGLAYYKKSFNEQLDQLNKYLTNFQYGSAARVTDTPSENSPVFVPK